MMPLIALSLVSFYYLNKAFITSMFICSSSTINICDVDEDLTVLAEDLEF